MKITGKNLLAYIHNAIDCSVLESGGVIPCRFTSEQIKTYNILSSNLDFEKRAEASANVTIDLETDSSILGLEYVSEICVDKGFMSFDLMVNGRLFASEYITNYNTKLIAFKLPKGLKHLQLFFPWNAKVEIKSVFLDDNSIINPVSYEKKIIAFGDSITQGFIVTHPSLSYVGRITNLAGAEVLNQGVGGFLFDERSLDTELKEYNPDSIIIGYGTNDASSINSLEEIINNQKKYLEKLRAVFPQTKIVAFLPVWGNDPRLQARNMVRDFNCQDVNRELEKTYVTYNIQVVRDNFFPKINDFYSGDLVHPNNLGGTLMGDEILQYLVQ